MTQKIVLYTLTQSGEVPNFIFDGGHFPKKNNLDSPQDYDFIGLTDDHSLESNFETKAELLDYVTSFMSDTYDFTTNKVYEIETLVNDWCNERSIA